MTNHKVKCANFEIANNKSFTLIAGPCQLESEQHALDISKELKKISSGNFRTEEVAKLGNKVAADYLLISSLSNVELKKISKKLMGEKISFIKSSVSVSVNIIDIATSQVVFSDDFELGQSGGSINSLAKVISNRLSRKITDTFFPAKVVALDNKTIIVDQGKSFFNKKTKYRLFQLGGKIIDPTELSKVVSKLGGYAFVKQNRKWQNVRKALSLPEMSSSGSQINKAYIAYFGFQQERISTSSISSVAPPPVHKKQRVSSSSSSSSSSNSSSSNSNHSSSNRSSSSINHSSSNSNSSSINNSNNINNIRVQRNSTDRHENSFSVDEVVQVFWQDPYSSKEWWKARLRGRRRKGLHEIQFMVFFEVDSSWDWVAANRVRKIQ